MAQLQQLTQLMTSPAPALTITLPLASAPFPPVSPLPLVPNTLSKQRARPKLPSPLDFSSEQSSDQAFLNSCTLYLHLALEQFSCDKEKIFWTLVFFKGRRAAKWSENLFCQKADAINALEGSLYYQGNWTVNNYLDSFLILTSDAGYMDLQTLVVKFRCRLKLNVQSQITTMPFERPTNTDLEVWYAAAQRINQV